MDKDSYEKLKIYCAEHAKWVITGDNNKGVNKVVLVKDLLDYFKEFKDEQG